MDTPDLGRVGIWSGRVSRLPATEAAQFARTVESLGFRTLWYPESLAKESIALAGFLLAQTSTLVIATGIANIWARDSMAAINAARTLAEAYPDRFVLGLGVAHAPMVSTRGHVYEAPIEAMKRYLDGMESATYMGPRPVREPPVILAALGPMMLALAAERTIGAHPYFVPVEHTKQAREVLGEGPLLAPEQAVVLATDAGEARKAAREHTEHYLQLRNYRANLLRLGWAAPDLEGGGSDELVDTIVGWGDIDAVVERVAAHFDAGADHVSVQVLNGPADRFPDESLTELAPALRDL